MKAKNISAIKAYHDILFSASITDKEKMSLTSLIALLITKNYKKFKKEYRELLLNKEKEPSEVLVNLGIEFLETLELDSQFEMKVKNLWRTLSDKSSLNIVKKDSNTGDINLIRIVDSFIFNCLPAIQSNDKEDTLDFLGQMFAEINGHGAKGKTGIVLTPYFLTDFMTDLLELDYKKDVLFDGACGSGSFLVTAYIKMYMKMEKDLDEDKITTKEFDFYKEKLNRSLFGNDIDEQMAILALTNFALLGIDIKNISNKDFFSLDANWFDENKVNKAILNPPFEYDPAKFCLHMIENINITETDLDKIFVVICPPQSLSKNSDKYLSKILNLSKLTVVIEVQSNAFQESNISFGTSIFVFKIGKHHKKEDEVIYFDFTDSGYQYFKDSGLVDKDNKFKEKKEKAISLLKDKKNFEKENSRKWNTFFDIADENNFVISIDPNRIAMKDVEETDLTKANQEMKLILKEKQELIDSVDNKIPNTEEFENYLVDILSKIGE